MTAAVRIEAEAWGDLRFATLARLCGFADVEHALIKCARIWSWQTEYFTFEQPTYVVDRDIIDSALGPGGAVALVRARLAEEHPNGFRIKGSEGRIEWLWKLRVASNKGGEANKRRLRNKRKPEGYPQGKPSDEPMAKPIGSPPAPATDPDQRSQNSLRARDPWVPGAKYDRHEPTHVGALIGLTYTRVAKARLEVAAELGLKAMPLPAHDTGAQPIGVRDLRERIRGEGDIAPEVCDGIVESAIASARESRSVEFLSEKLFTEGGWRTARNWFPGKTPRAGPRSVMPSPGDIAMLELERLEREEKQRDGN